jgi:hypothetical protein
MPNRIMLLRLSLHVFLGHYISIWHVNVNALADSDIALF